MKQLIAATTLSLIVSSCASTQINQQNSPDENLNELYQLSLRQFKTLPADTDTIITDRRAEVTSPHLDGKWFYSQLNTRKEQKLYRQRLNKLELSADGKSVLQLTYLLKSPDEFEDAWDFPDKLQNITQNDIEKFFNAGCELVWTPNKDASWTGYVSPETCRIYSGKRDTHIRIESDAYMSPETYKTTERGFSDDMDFLWGSKPGEFITLKPIASE